MSKQKPQGWAFRRRNAEEADMRIFQSALTHPAALMDLNL